MFILTITHWPASRRRKKFPAVPRRGSTCRRDMRHRVTIFAAMVHGMTRGVASLACSGRPNRLEAERWWKALAGAAKWNRQMEPPNGAARLCFPPPEGRDAVLCTFRRIGHVESRAETLSGRPRPGTSSAFFESMVKCAFRARYIQPLYPSPGFPTGLKDRKWHTAPKRRSWNTASQGRRCAKTVSQSARFPPYLATHPTGMILPAGWRRRYSAPQFAFLIVGKGSRRAPPSRPLGRSAPPVAFHHATEKTRY